MSEARRIPELLCPAGSEASLAAAIEGGADAVYLGGASMNARVHAENFTPDAMKAAIRLAHTYGVKAYVTLNTLVSDRELPLCLDAARDACAAGADALIVADLGVAAMLRRAIPEMELHASTQMSGHNSLMGAELRDLGFTRMVVAREISREDLRLLLRESPIETELFVHGALCVSHSGQCLFSSLVGGRSGNRGACAQPCRLPFGERGEERYPLSLKDLSLAKHVPELVKMGVASFKIEGRMKSPEYVYHTARIWRRLLDENRSATPAELREMSDAFSRGGFTDAYYTDRIGRSMLGVRSENDKRNTKTVSPFEGLTRRVPITLQASLQKDLPVTLTLSDGRNTVTVEGEPPQEARTAPMTEESVLRSLCRFGGTPYEVRAAEARVAEGLMMPVSALNALRRRAVEALADFGEPPARVASELQPNLPQKQRVERTTARFLRASQITPTAKAFFERRFLPLFSFAECANGVVLPPVIFDRDLEEIRSALRAVRARGAEYALVGNLGHLSLAREAGLVPVADFRMNLCNREAVALCESLGFEGAVLSAEMTLPQIRDVGGETAAIVYGRIPLMTLEKCVSREISDCQNCSLGGVKLTDRRGVAFPVVREWRHRSVVLNSLPTSMSNRGAELNRYCVTDRHFLFTVEDPTEVDAVIEAFGKDQPTVGVCRRIGTS